MGKVGVSRACFMVEASTCNYQTHIPLEIQVEIYEVKVEA